MKKHRLKRSVFKSSGDRSIDLEEHCRKVHADAVVHAFRLLCSVPAKLLERKARADGQDFSTLARRHADGLAVNR